LDIYKDSWKFLILKISWELIYSDEFYSFAQYLINLKSLWIPIILVYWWWNQITCKYKELTWKDREKWKDWSNYTSLDLIDQWVKPAYEDIKSFLEEVFWLDNINAFDENDIMCKQVEGLWEVWKVEHFDKWFSKDKINIVPFVWKNILNNNLLNVNADDVVNKIASEFKDKIINIIFLTWTWWIKDSNDKVVSFLTLEKVEKILKWKNIFDKFLEKVNKILCLNKSYITVKWWMQKKLESIYDLLKKWVSKVTIASLWGLKEELEWFGSGTMIIDFEKAKFTKSLNKGIFEMIYKKNVDVGYWKERDQEEKDKILDNYTVLEIDWTILGGYALSDYKYKLKKWKLLECMFSFKIWCWIWHKLWDKIKEEKVVYTYSKQKKFFKKLWFKKTKKVDSKTWSSLFIYKK